MEEGQQQLPSQLRLGEKRKAMSISPPSPSFSSPSSSVTNEQQQDHRTIFPLLLAAITNISHTHSRSIIKRTLQNHLITIKTSPPPPVETVLPHGLLSLLPVLISTTRRYPSLCVMAAEVIGAIALNSMDANSELSTDDGIVRGFVGAFCDWRRMVKEDKAKKKKKVVVMALCNAILDLSINPCSREWISQLPLLVELLSLFRQVTNGHVQSLVGFCADMWANKFVKDKLSMVVLDTLLTLMNTYNKDILTSIPRELLSTSLASLKKLWIMLQSQQSPTQSREEGEEYTCSRKHDLAEVIFRLSINEVQYPSYDIDTVKRDIFGSSSECDFEHFLSNYWEDSPFLFVGSSENSDNQNIALGSLIKTFIGKSTDALFSSVLNGTISCPPLNSDEFDIFNFLQEMKGGLGSPLVYGQDIRVIRTECTHSSSQNEIHFFNYDKTNPKVIFIDDIQKCKQAFHQGFTIALRGMEFRSKKIASIADGLACLFGMPSVGVNLYLTPPGSQGLSQHYDDHCVFVCQIVGQKKWVLFPSPTAPVLPRLYEPLENLSCLNCEGKPSDLHEGNILYIPRGSPHEAHTVIGDVEAKSKESCVGSLHLTFSIEVEPPFEWEGFAHTALHCWSKTRNYRSQHHHSLCQLQVPDLMFVNLLHIAISMIGVNEPIFRKACMVSMCSSKVATDKPVFQCIVNIIDSKSNFLEVFKTVKVIVDERNDEPLQWLRWVQYLLPQNNKKQNDKKNAFCEIHEELEGFIQLSDGRNNLDYIETTFVELKSEFCRQVVFEDACKSFEVLLEDYRKIRKQYTNDEQLSDLDMKKKNRESQREKGSKQNGFLHTLAHQVFNAFWRPRRRLLTCLLCSYYILFLK